MLLGVVLDGEVLCAVLEAAELWSVELGVCAGGFTGVLALSPWLPAGLVVVAAGAFALFWSVVGVWLPPVAVAAALSAVLLAASAVWFAACEPAAAALVAAPVAAPAAAPAAPLAELSMLLAAWLLVQESEIMLTELTCTEPSLARVPWI